MEHKRKPGRPRGTRQANPNATVYIDKEDLTRALITAREQDILTDELAALMFRLCTNYSNSYNFRHYSYKEDMVGKAMLDFARSWRSFDPVKIQKNGAPPNPFAYLTTCAHRSFLKFMNDEKKQRDIIDAIRFDQGYEPLGLGGMDSDATAFGANE